VLKGIVFDLDGTLLDTPLDLEETRKAVLKVLAKHGVPERLLSASDYIERNKERAFQYLIKIGKASPDLLEKISSEVDEVLCELELKRLGKSKLYPNVKEMLSMLKRMGFKLALFTFSSRRIVQKLIESEGLKDLFDVVVTRNDVSKPKPNLEHLQSTIEKLGLKPSEVAVVSDGLSDLKNAKALGCVSIGVLTGFGSRERFREAKPDFVLEKATDLLMILEELRAARGTTRLLSASSRRVS